MQTDTTSGRTRIVLKGDSSGAKNLLGGLQLNPLPAPKQRGTNIAHAPKRNHGLSTDGQKVKKLKINQLLKVFRILLF